jgi:hypothetical protein
MQEQERCVSCGTEFIPKATLDRLLETVSDYEHYKHIYSFNIVESQVLARSAIKVRYARRSVNRSGNVTVAADTEQMVRSLRLSPDRAYALSESTLVRQFRKYGKANQSELPPGRRGGFIWRLFFVSRHHQRDRGVHVDLQSIARTRYIPGSIRWLVVPMLAKILRNSLTIALSQVRIALCVRKNCFDPLQACSKTSDAGATFREDER